MENNQKKSRIFRLSLVDASSHARLWSLRFSRPVFIAAAVSSAVVLVLLLFSLIAFTPIRTFIPGYPDAHSRRQAVQNAQRIDSLQTRILQWELYTENLRRIVAGEEAIRMDSLILGSQPLRGASDSATLAIRDSILRADVEIQEQFQISGSPRREHLPIEAQSFYVPVKGVISNGFEASLHPWVDVTAPEGSMVMSVLDGTVVFTSWDSESGYSVVIQHGSDIVSVYRNNEKALRKNGEKVKAGTPVGVLASSSSLTKGNHLHFELWYDGKAVDPAEYIKF